MVPLKSVFSFVLKQIGGFSIFDPRDTFGEHFNYSFPKNRPPYHMLDADKEHDLFNDA